MTSIPSSRACYSAICRTSGGTWSIRARATAGRRFPLSISRALASITQSAPVTSFVRVIDAILPLRRRLAGKLERSGPFSARFPAIFSSPYKGPCGLLIKIWAGSKSTAGKCFSLLCALLKHCQEPRSRIFWSFSFSPVLSFAPTVHAHKKAWSWMHDEHGNSAFGAIGVKNNV